MKVLYNLFLVAVAIIERADAAPGTSYQDGNKIPVDVKVRAYRLSSESSSDKENSLPFSFSGSNEAGEVFGGETNMVIGYDAISHYYALDEYDLLPPSGGFGNGNLFRAAAQASSSTEVDTGKTTQNGETVQADASHRAQLQGQFGRKAQYRTPTQVDALFQEKRVIQNGYRSKAQTSPQGIVARNISGSYINQEFKGPVVGPLGYGDSNSKNNMYKGSLPDPSWSGELLNQPSNRPGLLSAGLARLSLKYQSDAFGGGKFVVAPQYNKDGDFRYNNGLPVDTKYVVFLNGYNNNKLWYPYTKSAEAESLVQTEGVEVQTNKGVEITGASGQYNAESQPVAMPTTQFTSPAYADTNVAFPYSRGTQHNAGVYFKEGSKTNPEAQMNQGIIYGEAKYSESSFYGDTAKNNGGSLNGEQFQPNAKSHLVNGAQFGGAVDAKAVDPAGNVIETRLGKKTRPPRRPVPGFGFKHPHNGWYHG